jgi:DNA-binding protein H-NS
MKIEQMSMAELKVAIDRIKVELERRRVDELKAVVAEIREKMDRHGLTVADLGFTAAERSVARSGGRGTRVGQDRRRVVAPKYQDPASGATWSGRGRTPLWLAAAMESGRSREEFLIKG